VQWKLASERVAEDFHFREEPAMKIKCVSGRSLLRQLIRSAGNLDLKFR